MTIHIVKLCVGCDSFEELADWQRERLAAGHDLLHVTRQTPRREGFGPHSSLYWRLEANRLRPKLSTPICKRRICGPSSKPNQPA